MCMFSVDLVIFFHSSTFLKYRCKKTQDYNPGLKVSGWRRIRTFEGVANRFTVCPLWPLGNPSLNVLNYIGIMSKMQALFSVKW